MPQTRATNERCKLDNAKQVKLWFDVLPTDVLIRLTVHLSLGGYQNYYLLHLALLDERLRLAAVSILNGRHFDESIPRDFPWRQIFLNSGLVEIEVHSPRNRQHVSSLLRKPTLRKATVDSHPFLLTALARSSSVVDLTIRQTFDWSSQLVLDTLQKLPLQNLALQCNLYSRCSCCLRSNGLRTITPPMISARCPHLVRFELIVGHDPDNVVSKLYWPFIQNIPSLRHGSLHTLAPKEVLDRFQAFETVTVRLDSRNSVHGVFLARQFPNTIVELRLQNHFLDPIQVRQIPALPNLKHLEFGVSKGAETALIDVCKTLSSLHSLHLRWPHVVEESVDCEMEFSNIVQGAIYSLMKACPKLTELSLLEVEIPTAELQLVMRTVGPRLETFAVSTVSQEEGEFERIVTIFCCAEQFNPNLRYLHFANPLTRRPIRGFRMQGAVERKMIAYSSHLIKRRPYWHCMGAPCMM